MRRLNVNLLYDDLRGTIISACSCESTQMGIKSKKGGESEDVGRMIWGPCSARMEKNGSTFGDEGFARLTKNRNIRRSDVRASQLFFRDFHHLYAQPEQVYL